VIETLNMLAERYGHGNLLKREASIPQEVAAYLRGDYVGGTYAGRAVTPNSALQHSAVWACVDLRGKAVAQMPLLAYRRRPDGGKDRAADHYSYRLLRWRANPFLTAFRWKRLMQNWLDLYGNAYAELEVNGRGQTLAIWPWRPDRVRVEVDVETQAPRYYYRLKSGVEIQRPWWLMIHLRGLSTDGIMGVSPVAAHRQRIGLGLAMVDHSAMFFRNGARPLGVLKHPGKVANVERLRESWQAAHGGLENAHRVAILEEAMDYKEIGLSMVDSQFLEQMQYGVSDIARIFGVQPHKIGDLTRSTNNNIEHQGLEWLQDSLGPELVNWEQELTNSLFSDDEARQIEIEFLVNSILRADSKARGELYAKGRQWGWLSANDVRRLENMNPIEGGDEYLSPMNMLPAGTRPGSEGADEPEAGDTDKSGRG
jgi:HK97 family phage portal protein